MTTDQFVWKMQAIILLVKNKFTVNKDTKSAAEKMQSFCNTKQQWGIGTTFNNAAQLIKVWTFSTDIKVGDFRKSNYSSLAT